MDVAEQRLIRVFGERDSFLSKSLLAELELLLGIDSDDGGGNGKLAAPSTSVLPSKTMVAVAARSLRVDPGPLTVVMIGPVPVQRASNETACNPPRLSGTFVNVPLTLTFLRSGSNCVGAARTKPQLKVPSGHWPTNPTLRGGLGLGVVPASVKLSVSTIRRPSAAVEPSGHWNGVDQRAEATCSVKPFAADATAGTASNVSAASRETTYRYGREGRWADRLRGNRRPRIGDSVLGVRAVGHSQPADSSYARDSERFTIAHG